MEKQDLLFVDVDDNGVVSSGDTLLYTIRIRNEGTQPVDEILLEDKPDINTTLIQGSVQSSAGTVSSGNGEGDQSVSLKIATLAPGSTVQVSFQVQIHDQSNVAVLVNQATVFAGVEPGNPGGQQQIVSDDPDTITPGDATLTPLGSISIRTLFLPLISR